MKLFSLPSLRPLAFLALLCTGLLGTACQSDDEPVKPADEDRTIQRYITDNKLTGAQRQASGLYYVPLVTNPTAIKAQPNSTADGL